MICPHRHATADGPRFAPYLAPCILPCIGWAYSILGNAAMYPFVVNTVKSQIQLVYDATVYKMTQPIETRLSSVFPGIARIPYTRHYVQCGIHGSDGTFECSPCRNKFSGDGLGFVLKDPMSHSRFSKQTGIHFPAVNFPVRVKTTKFFAWVYVHPQYGAAKDLDMLVSSVAFHRRLPLSITTFVASTAYMMFLGALHLFPKYNQL